MSPAPPPHGLPPALLPWPPAAWDRLRAALGAPELSSASAVWMSAPTTAPPDIARARGGSSPASRSARPMPGASQRNEAVTTRLVALVNLARGGDAEAFGQLYDHYVTGVYRFVRARVGNSQLAEDLTAETFLRALRSIGEYSWQGRDFGAWLTAIARNLVADHYKSSRVRLEMITDELPQEVPTVPDSAETAITGLTNELLWQGVRALRRDQQECLVMRFLQGLSIRETALALGRSEGAVKQLQLRAMRSLARQLPEGLL